MKKFNKIVVLGLMLSFGLVRAVDTVISRYDAKRDLPAIRKILKDYPHLTYEALGYPAGTTEKYLGSSKYMTNVLRVDDKTVGFINYAASNRTFLTFHIARSGIIHLMGVDNKYLRKGYATQLFNWALSKIIEQKVPVIYLNVRVDNAGAIALYEKAGFAAMIPRERVLEIGLKDIPYALIFSVLPADLPKGNLAQQYPRTALGLVMATVCAGAYLILKRK